MQDLIELEKQGWKALSTSKEAATEFYRSLLIDGAIMTFPGGMMLVGKNQMLESINSQPWETFDITEPQELSLSEVTRNPCVQNYYTAYRKRTI